MTPQPARFFKQVIKQDLLDKIFFLSLFTRLTLAQLKRQMGFFTWCAKEHLAQSSDCVLKGLASCKMPNTVPDKVHKRKTYKTSRRESVIKQESESALNSNWTR